MTVDRRTLDDDAERVVRPDRCCQTSLHSPVTSLQDKPSEEPITVAAVMTAPAPVAGPAAPLYEIVDRMLTLGEDEIVVVVDNHPQGVLTQRHLQAILHPAPHGWTARRATDLLPSALPTLLPDTQVAAAAALMTRERVEALAVVDDNGRLLGVVSRRHLDNRLNDRQPHAAATPEPVGPDRCCRWEVPPSPGGPTCRSASGDVVRQSR